MRKHGRVAVQRNVDVAACNYNNTEAASDVEV